MSGHEYINGYMEVVTATWLNWAGVFVHLLAFVSAPSYIFYLRYCKHSVNTLKPAHFFPIYDSFFIILASFLFSMLLLQIVVNISAHSSAGCDFRYCSIDGFLEGDPLFCSGLWFLSHLYVDIFICLLTIYPLLLWTKSSLSASSVRSTRTQMLLWLAFCAGMQACGCMLDLEWIRRLIFRILEFIFILLVATNKLSLLPCKTFATLRLRPTAKYAAWNGLMFSGSLIMYQALDPRSETDALRDTNTFTWYLGGVFLFSNVLVFSQAWSLIYSVHQELKFWRGQWLGTSNMNSFSFSTSGALNMGQSQKPLLQDDTKEFFNLLDAHDRHLLDFSNLEIGL